MLFLEEVLGIIVDLAILLFEYIGGYYSVCES